MFSARMKNTKKVIVVPETSYNHFLSTGDRRSYKPSLINYTTTGTFFRVEQSGSLIDGLTAKNSLRQLGLNTSSYTNNNSIIIYFTTPTLLTEITFFASTTGLGYIHNNGEWVVQKYTSGAWSSNLCTPTTLMGDSNNPAIFTLNNSEFCTQYRLLNVSGSTNYDSYFQEIQFKMVQ
jgi:hypothetical protein